MDPFPRGVRSVLHQSAVAGVERALPKEHPSSLNPPNVNGRPENYGLTESLRLFSLLWSLTLSAFTIRSPVGLYSMRKPDLYSYRWGEKTFIIPDCLWFNLLSFEKEKKDNFPNHLLLIYQPITPHTHTPLKNEIEEFIFKTQISLFLFVSPLIG